jgi:hypothetical protein
MTRTKGTFEVTGWDEKTFDELDGKGKMTRARIAQDYSGDLEGQGTWDLLMCYREDGTAVFTGFGKVTGRIGGRSGSFVLQSQGDFDGAAARSEWSVITGSGTGDLKGVGGKGTSAAPHGSTGTYELSLDLA